MRELGEVLQRLEDAAAQYAKVRGDPDQQDAAHWWGRELSLLEWVLGQEYVVRPIMVRPQEPKGPSPEHFTPAARHALSLAVEEARRLKCNDIGTTHLLLGLLREDGYAAYVLKGMGVDLEKAQAAVEEALNDTNQGYSPPPKQEA